MALISVPCAVCRGEDFTLVYGGTIPAGDPTPPFLYYASSRQKAGYFPIVRCNGCGLVMTNPRDDMETLGQVYSALQDPIYAAEDDNRRRTAEEHFRLVQHYCPRPGRLLDVGCATGSFVCVGQQAGWQVTGLDASHWSVNQARQHCPEANFIISLLEEAHFPAGIFEVITLWDVLEHVTSPAGTLQRLHHWLAPGGFLFLNLPNSHSLTARMMGRYWVLLLREHLWYFSPATIERLLRQNGFAPAGTRPNFVHFSLANIFGRLAQYPGWVGRVANKLQRIPVLKRLSMRFPMGEMQVIAQKREP